VPSPVVAASLFLFQALARDNFLFFVLAFFLYFAMILPVELSPALALGLTLILTGALTCEF
jgi:hypothetical protein